MSEELNLNEMEKVNGGTGGSPTPLPPKSGCEVYGNTDLISISSGISTPYMV